MTRSSETVDTVTAARADRLRALHAPGTSPLLLPNAWDAASARTVAGAGFPAIATASAAMAPTLGFDDHEHAPVDEILAAVARMVNAVDLPVTADMEHGYGLAPDEFAARLVETGAVGCNLEDTDPSTGQPTDVEAQAEYLAAVREHAPHLVLNARVDNLLFADDGGRAGLDEALARGRRYVEAGADCVYPISIHGLSEETVRAMVQNVGAPINLAFLPGSGWSLDKLAEVGVGRVSFGPGLYMVLQAQLATMVGRLAEGGDPYQGTPLEHGVQAG